MDLVAAAKALADQLKDEGDVRAYHDPSKAWNNRPCLLVAPPALDWTEGTLSGSTLVIWRVIALSSHPTGSIEALKELSALVNAANDVLKIETATTARYRLNDKNEPAAAYVCTHTEIQE